MNWYTLHIDDDHVYETSIHPSRQRTQKRREAAGFIGRDDLVSDDYGGQALITEHEVPFSEVLLLSLIIAGVGVLAVVCAVLYVAAS